jgi:hypothetical protein
MWQRGGGAGAIFAGDPEVAAKAGGAKDPAVNATTNLSSAHPVGCQFLYARSTLYIASLRALVRLSFKIQTTNPEPKTANIPVRTCPQHQTQILDPNT